MLMPEKNQLAAGGRRSATTVRGKICQVFVVVAAAAYVGMLFLHVKDDFKCFSFFDHFKSFGDHAQWQPM